MNNVLINSLSKASWPFKMAEDILKSINYTTPEKGYVLFETGYGPSGLPHIGTFGEVVRTTMVMHAFRTITENKIPMKLWCVSDDMDGMRKIPDTIPNKEDYIKYIGLPLTKIPDPFGTHSSYGDHMNARLCAFLDNFKFEYEFISSSKYYKEGKFNDALIQVLRHYDDIMNIMIPTLGEERQATYSPFLPICLKTGVVLQVPVISRDEKEGMISYKDPISNDIINVSVLNGNCKLQWKPDFGMRWYAFKVNFEMYGKDHLVNGEVYSKICKALGGKPPVQMFYELFLDDKGQKISKSKGNGLTIDEWLKYAPKESLALFMYVNPQRAKKLYFDVIPKHVDEYITYLTKYNEIITKKAEDNVNDGDENFIQQVANPVFHIHNGNPPKINIGFSYSLLLNLVNACNTDNSNVIWGYLINFTNNPEIENMDFAQQMVKGAINYYQDFIKPNKKYRKPTVEEKKALNELIIQLENLLKEKNDNQIEYTAEIIQNIIYNIGKNNGFELKNWFQGLYEILLGSSQGPRFGSFIMLYGVDCSINMMKIAVM